MLPPTNPIFPPGQLPAELVDALIDHFYDDKDSSCLYSGPQIVAFNDFIAHLKSPHSTIGHHIHHIVLSQCSALDDPETVLLEIVALAPVKKVTITGMYWEEIRLYNPVAFTFNDISKLELYNASFELFSDVATLIWK